MATEWTVVRRLCSKELRSAVTEGSVDSSFSNLTQSEPLPSRLVYTGEITFIANDLRIWELDRKFLVFAPTDNFVASYGLGIRVGSTVKLYNLHPMKGFSTEAAFCFSLCAWSCVEVVSCSPEDCSESHPICLSDLPPKEMTFSSCLERFWCLQICCALSQKFDKLTGLKRPQCITINSFIRLPSDIRRKATRYAERIVKSYDLPLYRRRILHELFEHEMECDLAVQRVARQSNVVLIKDLLCHPLVLQAVAHCRKKEGNFYQVLSTDLDVLLVGILHCDHTSGKLILQDASGSVEVFTPTHTWHLNNIYYFKYFTVYVESRGGAFEAPDVFVLLNFEWKSAFCVALRRTRGLITSKEVVCLFLEMVSFRRQSFAPHRSWEFHAQGMGFPRDIFENSAVLEDYPRRIYMEFRGKAAKWRPILHLGSFYRLTNIVIQDKSDILKTSVLEEFIVSNAESKQVSTFPELPKVRHFEKKGKLLLELFALKNQFMEQTSNYLRVGDLYKGGYTNAVVSFKGRISSRSLTRESAHVHPSSDKQVLVLGVTDDEGLDELPVYIDLSKIKETYGLYPGATAVFRNVIVVLSRFQNLYCCVELCSQVEVGSCAEAATGAFFTSSLRKMRGVFPDPAALKNLSTTRIYDLHVAATGDTSKLRRQTVYRIACSVEQIIALNFYWRCSTCSTAFTGQSCSSDQCEGGGLVTFSRFTIEDGSGEATVYLEETHEVLYNLLHLNNNECLEVEKECSRRGSIYFSIFEKSSCPAEGTLLHKIVSDTRRHKPVILYCTLCFNKKPSTLADKGRVALGNHKLYLKGLKLRSLNTVKEAHRLLSCLKKKITVNNTAATTAEDE
ncbi:uncharacterized protein LOC135145979 [Zophobas morio]|uniref:uncharacterized protein LOC135145979 n=1 Tax=Zophobas morio TaxID=2755281 RepID=UPI003083DB29